MKVNIMKLFLLFVLAFGFLHLPVKAEETVIRNPSTGYEAVIDDSQDLLSDDEEKLLKVIMYRMTDYGNCMFVSAYQEESTSYYSRKTYRDRYGKAAGTILVIDMYNRIIYIHNDGEVSKIITNAYSNSITDNSYSYASRGNYYQCAYSIFDQEFTLLQGGRIAQPMKHITNLLIAFLTALLINFMVLVFNRTPEEVSRENQNSLVLANGLAVTHASAKMLKRKIKYSPRSSDYGGSSSGGSWSSGGSSGGGYSGGSSSGGGGGSGGGHRF
ncbi:MAG: TPM domain-containing protein [Solobacterium sp.]|nr:TPM domain-containing protein [Solobacterium sp.]